MSDVAEGPRSGRAERRRWTIARSPSMKEIMVAMPIVRSCEEWPSTRPGSGVAGGQACLRATRAVAMLASIVSYCAIV